MVPTTVGPFEAPGATPEPLTTAMIANTPAFDPAVASPPGDLWQIAVNPAAALGTVIVNPGQSATIPVTITPSGPAGQSASGTLYVDHASLVDFGSLIPDGNQLAAPPYTYTTG